MNYNLLIGITAVVAAGVTVTLTYLKDKEDNQVSDARNAQIIGLQQQVIQTQAQLVARTEELNNEVTGGNSFCVLDIRIMRSFNHHDPHSPVIWSEMISAVNEGDYELTNVHISVEKPNLNLNFKRTQPYGRHNPELEQQFDIPSLIGKQDGQRHGIGLIDRDLPEWQIKDNKITYAATIVIKKGRYSQISKFVLDKNVWRSATAVWNAKMKVVYEQIDPNYPRKTDGSIDWTMIERPEQIMP